MSLNTPVDSTSGWWKIAQRGYAYAIQGRIEFLGRDRSPHSNSRVVLSPAERPAESNQSAPKLTHEAPARIARADEVRDRR